MARYLTLFVSGEPQAQQRPRFSTYRGHIQTYDSAKSRNAKAIIGMMAREKIGDQPYLEGDLMLTLTVNKRPPQSLSKKKRAALVNCGITTRPDLDNYIKLVLDALNGVWFKDDSSVTSIMARKAYSEDREGMTIMVSEIVREPSSEDS